MPFRVKKGLPVGFFEDYAVIGDVHLGFEEEINLDGYNVYSKTEEITQSILEINSKKLIMLGDIRASFGRITQQERGVLTTVLSRISDKFNEVIITKGNHDGGLDMITDKLENVKLVGEFIYGKTGFIHGHALPTTKLASEVSTICFGHLHPSVIVTDSNGVSYRKDCWSIFDVLLPKSKYKESSVKNAIAFPKFNPYIGSTDRTEGIGLIRYLHLRSRLDVDLVVV